MQLGLLQCSNNSSQTRKVVTSEQTRLPGFWILLFSLSLFEYQCELSEKMVTSVIARYLKQLLISQIRLFILPLYTGKHPASTSTLLQQMTTIILFRQVSIYLIGRL